MSQAAVATFKQLAYPGGSDNTQKSQILRGTVTFTVQAGSPPTQDTYPAGGFSLTSVYGSETVKSLPTSSTQGPLPFAAHAESVALPPSGYVYQFDNTNWNLHIFQVSGNGVLVELSSASALPAGVISDTVLVMLYFAKN
jgi:hypothetical protein